MKPVVHSSEADIAALDAVCDRLASFGTDVSTEWVDGFLTALVASRRVILPSEWLPAMFGDDFDRAFADPADVEQAMAALMGRWNVLANQLDPGSLIDDPDTIRLAPLMLECSDEFRARVVESGEMSAEEVEVLQTGAGWCLGFRDAIDAFADDWPDPEPGADDAEAYDDCLTRVLALGLSGEELASYVRDNYPADEPISRDDLIDDACFGVQDLRVYWLDHALRPAPRRVESQPGRNDPCPCGSGRKYKKCHGGGLH